jgi:hypothetical protein
MKTYKPPGRLRMAWHRTYWATRHQWLKAGVAWRYATGRTTTQDAWTLTHEMEDITGYYALEGIDRDTFVDSLRERFGDVPELHELATDACARVAGKWNSTGDISYAAEGWASDLVQRYAIERDITLVDSWAEERAEEDA